jgi:O-antigen ligase
VQLLVLGMIVIYEQKGWSVTKKIQSVLLVGSVVLLSLAVVPAAQVTRITTYSESSHDPGGKSIQHRLATVYAAIEMASANPILGIGLGNFIWMHKLYYGFENASHNSYLWMLTEGGIGVLTLYLLLFRITYRMLRQLEEAGPSELLWLSKGLRVNLILLLVFSIFANFWIGIFVYLIVGFAISMTRIWQQQVRILG